MDMKFKLNVILVGLFVFGALVVFQSNSDAQILPDNTIEVENTPLVPKSWSLLEKMSEKDDLLRDLSLSVSTKSLDFYESRISQNGDKVSMSRKKLSEQNKDIGMKIMNTDTGEVRVIKVSIKVQKDGIELIAPVGYQIDIVERTSGIRWNKWNTLYKISSPQGWLVLKNKYPDLTGTTQKVTIKNKAGKKITVSKKVFTVEEFIYSPYSGELHTPELVEAGREYLKSVVREAMTDLKDNQVSFRALSLNFFARLPILEQTDMTEFEADPQITVDRVLVLIGANKDVAFKKTGSKAGALGWVQFTPKTYSSLRKAYPSANLIADFAVGAADHLNSMKAAILLYDYNLTDLVRKHGNKILNDPRLEEYLAAGYNGSPSRASLSLKASIVANLSDWIDSLSSKRGGLANETKGYMAKIRYLQEKSLP